MKIKNNSGILFKMVLDNLNTSTIKIKSLENNTKKRKMFYFF